MTVERFLKLINGNKWTFAKSMPENPHWYSLRDTWKSDSDFVQFVLFIRENGYKERFWRKEFIYFNVNGYKYWTMGCPTHNCSKTGTILINRAKIKYKTKYDEIADVYDKLFIDEDSKKENQKIMEMINPQGSVLDIGCGTGLFLDYFPDYERYLGIDISDRMIRMLKEKHPDSEAINTSLNDFYSLEKYDTIIGLFGVGSYLTKDEINKIYSLVSDNGKIFIMHYKPEYYPETYKKTGIECKRYIHEQNGLKKIEFNNYLIYTNENIS